MCVTSILLTYLPGDAEMSDHLVVAVVVATVVVVVVVVAAAAAVARIGFVPNRVLFSPDRFAPPPHAACTHAEALIHHAN